MLVLFVCALFYVSEIVYAAVSASPNPCSASLCDSLCTSTITWTGEEHTGVWVSVDGGPEALFACSSGPPGTFHADAEWIGCNHNCEFRQYSVSGNDCITGTKGGLIGSVIVTGQNCNKGITFDIDNTDCGTDQSCIDKRKVLISNKGAKPYTSIYQESLTGTNPEKDRKIKITGSTTPSTDIWLRVADPDDPSPYEPDPQGATDDNVDETGPWHNGAMFEGCIDDTCPAKQVHSDQNGHFETVMTVTNRYAGDNYKVWGAFDEGFSCLPGCCLGGTITSWKRIYVEKDRMYRRGGFCTKTSNKVIVYPTTTAIRSRFTPGQTVLVQREMDFSRFEFS